MIFDFSLYSHKLFTRQGIDIIRRNYLLIGIKSIRVDS